MSIYLDASFMVSLYSVDANSSTAAAEMRHNSVLLLLSTFGELEVVNALRLRLFRKQDSSREAAASLAAFREDLRMGRFQVRPPPEFAFERARELSLQTTASLGNRAGDILHVAAALELGAEEFYSFDERQRKLARSMRLRLNG